MAFQYPKSMDDPDVPSYNREQFRRVHELYGSNSPDKMFGPSSPTTPTPWPSAPRTKTGPAWDRNRVNEELRRPPTEEHMRDYDPRNLHASQPTIVRSHAEYYLGPQWANTGRTAADQGDVGNQYPFVYERRTGENVILAGHHRAAAALLQGRGIRARYVTERE